MPTVKPKKGAPKPRGKKEEARYDRALMEPGEYEVTRSSTFTLEIPLVRRDEKWWVLTTGNEEPEKVHEVEFRMWSYDEMVELRKMATKYDTVRRVHMIDHDVLNRLKIQRFMLRWTFEEENPRLELHHVNGVMTDEAWAKVSRLQTNILKHIIDEMNERYEFGG